MQDTGRGGLRAALGRYMNQPPRRSATKRVRTEMSGACWCSSGLSVSMSDSVLRPWL